ncbi:LysR family transcriptional regulator [Xylophilus sp. Kf1]|nr:LysR family transcriptional regulator [Xylophilus sp. Kf1]
MTLKQLEAFYWAATCNSFAVAAGRLHLSLSSLSKRVAELESSMGVVLFDRSGRHARITPQGEQLLPGIRRLLHSAAELQASVTVSRGLRGHCRLGVGELSGLTWLPRLLAMAAEEHPDLQVSPQVDIGQVLERRIETGELDCIVIAGPSSRGGLASERIAQVDFVWVASLGFIARAGTDQPLRLLAEQRLITLPEGSGSNRILDQWLEGRDVELHRRLTCNSWGAVVGMVTEGLGFAFMPRRWAEAAVAAATRPAGATASAGEPQGTALRIIGRRSPLPPLQYTVQWRRDDARPLITEMRRMIQQVVAFDAPRCFVPRAGG